MVRTFYRTDIGRRVENSRKYLGLRALIEKIADPHLEGVLTFLARGSSPEKLDALEKQLRQNLQVPLKRILERIPPHLRTRISNKLANANIHDTITLCSNTRGGILRTRHTGKGSLTALEKAMAECGVYLLGQEPNPASQK